MQFFLLNLYLIKIQTYLDKFITSKTKRNNPRLKYLVKKLKGGEVVKKVLFAWIEQIVEFDSAEERSKFINSIDGVKVVKIDDADGKFTAHVKRPYNKNQMK